MKELMIKHKRAIAVVLALCIYFTLLTLISFLQAPSEYEATEENVVSYEDFVEEAGDDHVWLDAAGLHFSDTENTVKIFSVMLALEEFQQIQVSFVADCPQEYAGAAVLHVDLCADGYDTDAQEFTVELKAGRNEIVQSIDKGDSAPESARLRIFCLDSVQCDISGLSVQKMEEIERNEIWACVAIAVVLAALLLTVTLTGKERCDWNALVRRASFQWSRDEAEQTPSSSVPWKTLFLLFLISTILRGIIGARFGEYTIFPDEWAHVKLAQSIADGNGLMLRGALDKYTTCLYSIVISPIFCFVHNAQTAHMSIMWLNAALMSSAVFPIYLIARKFLTDSRHIWLAVAYGLLISEMNYTLQVMQENLNYPLVLWFFLAFTHIILEKKSNILNVSGLGAFAFLLSRCKDMNLAIVLAVVLYFLLQFLLDKTMRRQTVRDLLVYIGTYISFNCAFDFVVNLYLADAVVDNFFNEALQGIFNFDAVPKLIYPAIVYIILTVLATGIFPLPLLIGNWKVIPEKAQKMLTLIVSFLVISIGAICVLIVPLESFGEMRLRFHSRYYFYSFIIIIILYLGLYEESPKKEIEDKGSVFLLGYCVVLMKFIMNVISVHVDGVSTLFLRLMLSYGEVLSEAIRCITVGIVALGAYYLLKKRLKNVLRLTAIALLLVMPINFIQYINQEGVYEPTEIGDALVLNDYFADWKSKKNVGEDILIVGNAYASLFHFECYFDVPYRITVDGEASFAVGQAVDFSKINLAIRTCNWYAPYEGPPEFIISQTELYFQGYDEVDLSLQDFRLYRWNGGEVKRLRRETNIYEDRWLGAEAATLQLAGTRGCISAQVVLHVDSNLLGVDTMVNYTDSTGYTGSFIIPSTDTPVDICVPVNKMEDEVSYTINLIPGQTAVPGNGDDRQLSFRLLGSKIIEDIGGRAAADGRIDAAA